MDTYIDMHGLSAHLNTSGPVNERNVGAGFQAAHNGVLYLAGSYKNSRYVQSNYAAIGKEYPLAKYVVGGFIVGGVTGYDDTIRPVLMPFVAVGTDRLRVRLMLAAPVEDRPTTLMFSLQIKVSK